MENGFHGGRSSLGLGLRLRLVWWKQLQARDTRGSTRRLMHVGVCGNSWKLPQNMSVEASIDRSNGRFHFYRQRKFPYIPMEASTNLHGSKSTSTNVHRNLHGSKYFPTDFHVLPWKLWRNSMEAFMEVNWLPRKFPWKLAETSMEADRKELGDSCASRWKFVILVE